MLFPAEDIWLCPLNFGAHWILVVVKISSRSVLLLDPLGNEGCYERKIMRNWRNFLKMKGKEESRVDWKMETLPHNKQMDSSSCGVLVLKFAEHYLMSGEVTRVLSTPEAIGLQRTEIACELLEHQSNADDYCVVCSMLEADPESSMIEMVKQINHKCNIQLLATLFGPLELFHILSYYSHKHESILIVIPRERPIQSGVYVRSGTTVVHDSKQFLQMNN
ncbi:uncharacterized protein LOC120434192 [Oreochromis aureus]|uniref:uncharacterized protein LOC120434192 n=1 Tax=Oreochromis aureus TaxID=47969 RepID=UPI001954806E|nr:uncharacterized protein LOC120434192 [Oreochromis aureus]